LPFIPDDNWNQNDTQTNDAHIIRTDYGILEGRPPRITNFPNPVEYVEHPVAFVPTENAIISNPPTGTSVPENAPLDVTMIAMMGLTMAGAGLMKSESARKKQDELAKADALATATLATALAEQKESAQENWAENQAIRAEAKQQVYTKVTQSQANIDFWSSYTAWKIKVAEAEEKRRKAELEARIQAYYASLRLKPASPQPAQPAPVLGLLTGLLAGAKILG